MIFSLKTWHQWKKKLWKNWLLMIINNAWLWILRYVKSIGIFIFYFNALNTLLFYFEWFTKRMLYVKLQARCKENNSLSWKQSSSLMFVYKYCQVMKIPFLWQNKLRQTKETDLMCLKILLSTTISKNRLKCIPNQLIFK